MSVVMIVSDSVTNHKELCLIQVSSVSMCIGTYKPFRAEDDLRSTYFFSTLIA
jgi:hypothetical protein